MTIDAAVRAWQDALGPQRVLLGEAVQRLYGEDTGGLHREIPAALQVSHADQIPEVMRIATHHRVPIYPISSGHNWGYGSSLPVRDGCVILDMSALRRIIDFDADLGVVTVEPGVTQGMLAEFLEAESHPYLVPVTGAGPSCSLLANALERGFGVTPVADHFAAVTDVQAVLADGTMFRTAMAEAGSEELARLFKWGIGPYSAGLFSQGGFGVVTRASIALARRPDCVKVCLFGLQSDDLLELAIERIQQVLVRLPGTIGAINLMNRHRVLSMAAPYPRDRLGVNGLIPDEVLAELGRKYQIHAWTGFASLYGTKRVVRAAQAEIRSCLRGLASRLLFFTPVAAQTLARAARRLPGAFGHRLWQTADTLRRSLELVAGKPNETALTLAYWRKPRTATLGSPLNPARDRCGLIWYSPLVPMRPHVVRAFTQMVREVAPHHGIEPLITLTSLNDRLFDSTVPLIFDREDADAVSAARACYRTLLEAGRREGCFPYRVGIDSMTELFSLQSTAADFHRRLRSGLDPLDILAPGRYR